MSKGSFNAFLTACMARLLALHYSFLPPVNPLPLQKKKMMRKKKWSRMQFQIPASPMREKTRQIVFPSFRSLAFSAAPSKWITTITMKGGDHYCKTYKKCAHMHGGSKRARPTRLPFWLFHSSLFWFPSQCPHFINPSPSSLRWLRPALMQGKRRRGSVKTPCKAIQHTQHLLLFQK